MFEAFQNPSYTYFYESYLYRYWSCVDNFTIANSDHAVVGSTYYGSGEVVNVTCDPYFSNQEGQTEIVLACNRQGEWVDSNTFTSENVSYSNLYWINCDTPSWSCSDVFTIPNSDHSGAGSAYFGPQDSVVVTCVEGFTNQVGLSDFTMTCQEGNGNQNGSWAFEESYEEFSNCNYQACVDDFEIANSNHSNVGTEFYYFNDTFFIGCNAGYSNAQVLCSSSLSVTLSRSLSPYFFVRCIYLLEFLFLLLLRFFVFLELLLSCIITFDLRLPCLVLL